MLHSTQITVETAVISTHTATIARGPFMQVCDTPTHYGHLCSLLHPSSRTSLPSTVLCPQRRKLPTLCDHSHACLLSCPSLSSLVKSSSQSSASGIHKPSITSALIASPHPSGRSSLLEVAIRFVASGCPVKGRPIYHPHRAYRWSTCP